MVNRDAEKLSRARFLETSARIIRKVVAGSFITTQKDLALNNNDLRLGINIHEEDK